MTDAELRDQVDQRLADYRRRMIQEHATPLFCIGLGHDHNSGRSVVCIPDGVPLGVLVELLEQCLRLLKGKIES